ncbi:MAG: MBL fold metallo-hydrolase [Pseudomonadota bacterium]
MTLLSIRNYLISCVSALILSSQTASADDVDGTADVMYLGNAGIMVVQGSTKVLFDPLFRDDYGQYQLVPPEIRTRLFEAEPPFDNIDAVLISHAHGDHFNAVDIVKFHEAHPDALIVAPEQALDTMIATGSVTDAMAARFVSIDLDYGDVPVSIPFTSLTVEAVRIPHAGGAPRRPIENIAYRVTLEDEATVMHLGDADPTVEDFANYSDHWQARETDMAFPPYWFFLNFQGQAVVSAGLNASNATGVHVPIAVPQNLIETGQPFFASPGEVRSFQTE